MNNKSNPLVWDTLSENGEYCQSTTAHDPAQEFLILKEASILYGCLWLLKATKTLLISNQRKVTCPNSTRTNTWTVREIYIDLSSPKFECKITASNLGRKYQSYKGAVGTTLSHNEAELKMSKEIDHQTSSTDQAGKINLGRKYQWDGGVNVHLTFYICLILA